MSRIKEVLNKTIPFILKYKYVAIIVLAGIILILLPDFNTPETNTAADKDTAADVEYSIAELERSLENTLSKSNGAGRVSVTLALKSGTETIYAKDNKSSVKNGGSQEVVQDRQTEEKIVVVPAGGGVQEPLIIKRIFPEFMGAVIVCDGADSATVRLYVTEAVSSLTGLSSEKITVIKMKE